MTRRLFWKILIGFWITFLLIIEGVWLIFTLRDAPPREHEIAQSRLVAEAQLADAAFALEESGMAGLDALLADWPAALRARFGLWGAGATLPMADNTLTREAVAADGSRWTLSYDATPVPRVRPGPLDVPPPMIYLGIIGGLVFSAGLAGYLTWPIIRLRGGFATLAGGDLAVRLAPRMGRRRDEIADLAKDFDAMAERLEALVSQRDQLLNDVSHELRSPLARLQVSIGLARQNPERFDAVLHRIEDEARRIDAMVGELLSLARAEAGPPPGDDYFDLNSLALAVIGDARFEAEPARLTIASNLDAGRVEDVLIAGDAELMRRALENVLRNAIRHAPAGSTVSVDITPGPDRVAIAIADEGKGMAEADLARMFEPFVRGAGAHQGGFGLGLAIARRAVLSHGGTIEGHNRPGGGLEVRIELPVAPT
ncbi:HAMP domain-containing sensor histidine kinase [Zavarzinia aquatilis]|uniref:histidine kinase n=1 Tax=Zavarzinia aquatilis TaxID=2211142 RepID=A0A317E294_9PROT|nr:HAMP domain-containing sensor histidine kinase [Zavarzinia aquatilis]PWR20256.1 two-component sensor histidine kinase [Zavarzinia aquatilis]